MAGGKGLAWCLVQGWSASVDLQCQLPGTWQRWVASSSETSIQGGAGGHDLYKYEPDTSRVRQTTTESHAAEGETLLRRDLLPRMQKSPPWPNHSENVIGILVTGAILLRAWEASKQKGMGWWEKWTWPLLSERHHHKLQGVGPCLLCPS